MNARSEHSRYVKETSKVSEIADKFGNLRFKVVLDDKQFPEGYFVQVFGYADGNEEQLLNEEFPVLELATEFFSKTVEKYVYLVKSEEYSPHDIRIYADRIGYRGIYPECCFMCRWSRPSSGGQLFPSADPARRYECVCMHPTQFRQRDGRPEGEQLNIHPTVHALCVCDQFERPARTGAPLRVGSRPSKTRGGAGFSDEKVIQIIERNAPVILDVLDGIRDAEFRVDGGTAKD